MVTVFQTQGGEYTDWREMIPRTSFATPQIGVCNEKTQTGAKSP